MPAFEKPPVRATHPAVRNASHRSAQLPPPAAVEDLVAPRAAAGTSLLARRLADTVARRAGSTALPDGLRSGIERLSGVALDDVSVRYGSPEPARFDATAYARGGEIHLAPGHEADLAHEAWHVVQQRTGRVAPRSREHGIAVNDDPALELEAEAMGARALAGSGPAAPAPAAAQAPAEPVLQPNGSAARLLNRTHVEIGQFIARMSHRQLAKHRSDLLAHIADEEAPALTSLPKAKLRAIAPSILALEPLVTSLPDLKQITFYEQLDEAFKGATNPTIVRMLARGQVMALELAGLRAFMETFGYAKSSSTYVHKLFGHQTLTLYPIQKSELALSKQGAMRTVVHRPILDLERVADRWYARCYLGLLAKSTSPTHKDITADVHGTIVFTHILLMNIGNPMKALLWCEDYLNSSEHDSFPADPVLRSFLVPLSDVGNVFSGEGGARPLDQDRGSGNFGSSGSTDESSAYMNGKLHPLPGSLVSFFLNPTEYTTALPGQRKLPMSLLQHYLTGHADDPREMTTSGIAAQHGRKGHEATFADEYAETLGAYYMSVDPEETDFTDATKDEDAPKRGKYAKGRVAPAPVVYPF